MEVAAGRRGKGGWDFACNRAEDAAALAQAIPAALEIPRCIPLARVKRLFTRQIWIDQCEHLYRQVRAEACDAAGTARTRKP